MGSVGYLSSEACDIGMLNNKDYHQCIPSVRQVRVELEAILVEA